MQKIFSLLALATLTMSAWAANTYVKVTSVDQLEIGKKYILVNEEANVGMGALSNTSTVYGTTAAITIDNEAVDIEGTSVLELTAHKANSEQGGWIFGFGENYFIAWVSGNSLTSTHNTTGVASLNEQWYAAATDDGVILKSRYDQTRILQYNANAPRFACYTSSQKPAVLYMEGVPEDEGINTLSQANALEDAAEFAFNGDAVVTICWKGSVYLRDETGYGQVANYDGTFENGQVLNQGWTATKTSDNGWVKFIDAAGLSASGETNAELAAPQKLMGAVDESMLNAYVYVENVSKGFMPIRSIPLPDGTNILLTGTGNQPATGSYNIYGIIWKSGDALVFEPVAWEKYVEPVLRGDVNKSGNVDITDVTALIDYLLGGDASAINLDAADCNQVDGINISDVTALIDFLLSGTWD